MEKDGAEYRCQHERGQDKIWKGVLASIPLNKIKVAQIAYTEHTLSIHWSPTSSTRQGSGNCRVKGSEEDLLLVMIKGNGPPLLGQRKTLLDWQSL